MKCDLFQGLNAVDSVGRLQALLDEVINEVKAACFGTDGPKWKRCRGLLFELLDHSLTLATAAQAMERQASIWMSVAF